MKNINKLPFFETGKTGTLEFLGVSGTFREDFSKSVVLYKYEGEIIADCETRIGDERPILEVLVLETPEEVDRIILGNPFVKEVIEDSEEAGIYKISKHGESAFEIIEHRNHQYINFGDKVLNKVILEPGVDYDFALYYELFEESMFEDDDKEVLPIDEMLIFDVSRKDVAEYVKTKL